MPLVWDVIIVGAGLAGLVCAKSLQEQGQRVLILEKSRGLGGRMATRRLTETCWVDHGVPAWLQPLTLPDVQEFDSWQVLTAELLAQQSLQAWPAAIFLPQLAEFTTYGVPLGMTAIAKHLAQDLRIEQQQRVTAIAVNPTTHVWQVISVNDDQQPQAWFSQVLILAIPAPQALTLCQPLMAAGLALEFIQHLAQVRYHPCLTIMLMFAEGLSCENLPALVVNPEQIQGWAWEHQKRPRVTPLTLVLQTTPTLAQTYLEHTSLAEIGAQLWADIWTRSHLPDVWATPAQLQVHRWRYAQVSYPYPQPYLIAPLSPPLICCGDWCGDGNLAWGLGRAWYSGLRAATQCLELKA